MRAVRTLFLSALLAGPAMAHAQDCAAMSLFRQGAHQVRTSYNDKGKETGSTSMDVTAVTTSGAATVASIHSVSTDAKGKEVGTVDYNVSCEAGALRFEMKALVPAGSTEAYEGWTMTMEGSDLGYPAALAAGLTLPDATMTMTFTMPDAPPMIPPTKMTFVTKNRVVEGPESVTTPAGTFETWKVKYDTEMVTRGMMSMTTETSTIEWYVPGLGPVKSETFARGNSQGTTVLTENR